MADSSEFLCRYPELARVIPYTEMNPGAALEKLFKLYQKHAAEVKAAVKKLVMKHAVALIERTLPGECLLRSVTESGSVTSTAVAPAKPGDGEGAGRDGEGVPVRDKIIRIGRLGYRPGFEDVWLGDAHYDLRERKKARLCIQYLVEQRAFTPESARHLTEEIDPYVRREGGFPRSADIKIDHYFNDPHDPKKRLPSLRRELIVAAGRNGRYFLKTD